MLLGEDEINFALKVIPLLPYEHSLILPLSLERFIEIKNLSSHIRSFCFKVSHIKSERNIYVYCITYVVFTFKIRFGGTTSQFV